MTHKYRIIEIVPSSASLYIVAAILFYELSDGSSSSGAVFFEEVGCHDPPWLPILSNLMDRTLEK